MQAEINIDQLTLENMTQLVNLGMTRYARLIDNPDVIVFKATDAQATEDQKEDPHAVQP